MKLLLLLLLAYVLTTPMAAKAVDAPTISVETSGTQITAEVGTEEPIVPVHVQQWDGTAWATTQIHWINKDAVLIAQVGDGVKSRLYIPATDNAPEAFSEEITPGMESNLLEDGTSTGIGALVGLVIGGLLGSARATKKYRDGSGD